jgi:hypothetical protein
LKQFRIMSPTLEEQQVVVDRVECLRGRLHESVALLGQVEALMQALLPSVLQAVFDSRI